MVRRCMFVLCWAAAVTGCGLDRPAEPVAPAFSQGAAAATLGNPSQAVLWSGTSLRDAAPSGEVPECSAAPCDRFDLVVSLPKGVWQNRTGGVQVAVRWEGFGNNLMLYVYRDEELVAASDGIIATAQSVLLPFAENGEYRVYIAYDIGMPTEFGIPPAESIPYEALAEVEYAPKPQPRRALLPDLAARPQRNVTFDVPPAIFFEAGEPTTSCFPSEIAEEGAQLCLRFDQVLANIGEGALELRFVLPDDPVATPTGTLAQRIYGSDGSIVERPGGEWEYHDTHDHFHYTGFALSRLWAVDENGMRGNAPLRVRRHRPAAGEAPTRSGRKVSFCIVDIEIDRWARKGDAPRTYSAPACLIPTDDGALIQGLSAGWSDVYDWFLPDQYIDVHGLPDGVYLLDTIVDPDDTLLEANESNNCGAVYVRLTGMDGPQPAATLLGPAAACGGG